MATPEDDSHATRPPQPPNSPAIRPLETPSSPEKSPKRRRLSKDYPSPPYFASADATSGAPLAPHTPPPRDIDQDNIGAAPRRTSPEPPAAVNMDDDGPDLPATFPLINPDFPTPEIAATVWVNALRDGRNGFGNRDLIAFTKWVTLTFNSASNRSYFKLENVDRRIQFWTTIGEALMVMANSSTINRMMNVQSGSFPEDLCKALPRAAAVFTKLGAERADAERARRDSLGDGQKAKSFLQSENMRFFNYQKALLGLLEIDPTEYRSLPENRRKGLQTKLARSARSFIVHDQGGAVSVLLDLCSEIAGKLHEAELAPFASTLLQLVNSLLQNTSIYQTEQELLPFYVHTMRWFTELQPILHSWKITDEQTPAFRQSLITVYINVLHPILTALLEMDNEHALRFRKERLPQILTWQGRKDVAGALRFTPDDLLKAAMLLEKEGPVVEVYSWCVLSAGNSLKKDSPTERNYGIVFLYEIVKDVHGDLDIEKFYQPRTLVARVITSSGALQSALRAGLNESFGPCVDFILDFLIDVDAYDCTITDALWQNLTTTGDQTMRFFCLNRLHHVLVAKIPPPHILHLLKQIATADTGSPELFLEGLLENAQKQLGSIDLYTEYPDEQVEIVQVLVTLVLTLCTYDNPPHQNGMINNAIAGIKLLVRSRISSSVIAGIVSGCLRHILEDNVKAPGSMSTLSALLEATAHRVFEYKTPSDMATTIFGSFRDFLRKHEHDAPSPVLAFKALMYFHILVQSLSACQEPFDGISSEDFWNSTIEKNAYHPVNRASMLGTWAKMAATSPVLARLLLECISEGRFTPAALPSSSTHLLLFDFLMQCSSRRQILIGFLPTLVSAMVEAQDANVESELHRKIAKLAFDVESTCSSTERHEIQRTIARACLTAFLKGNEKAANHFKLLLWKSIEIKQPTEREGKKDIRIRDYSRENAPRVCSIDIRLPSYNDKDKEVSCETWEVDPDITVGEFKGYLQSLLGHEDLRIHHAGRRLSLGQDPEVGLGSLVKLEEKVFIVDTASKGGLAPANKGMGAPRAVFEEELIKQYWTVYDHLFNDGTIGSVAASLLSNIELPVEPHSYECADIEHVLDPAHPRSTNKTLYAVTLIVQNLDRQRDRNFVDVDRNVQSVRFLLSTLACEILDLTLLGAIAKLLKRLLQEAIPEEQRSKFFEDPESTYQLLVRLVIDIKDRVVHLTTEEVNAKDQLDAKHALNHLLESLYEAALCSDKIADILSMNDDATELFMSLLGDNGEDVAEVVYHSTTKILSMPDPETEVAICGTDFSPFEQAYLQRGNLIKTWLSKLSFDLMNDRSDDPKKSANIHRLAADAFPIYLRYLAGKTLLSDLAENAMHNILGIAEQESEHVLKLEAKIACLCRIIKNIVQKGREVGPPVKLPNPTLSVLQRLLFGDVPSEKKQKHLIRINEEWCRRDVYDTILVIATLQHDASPLVQGMLEIVEGFETDEQYTGRLDSIRTDGHPVGLENMSMTCYLNSLLQQLFMNIDFRTFLLNVPITDLDRQPVLKEVQKTFEFLQSSCRTAYRPEGLTRVLGIDVTVQEDAQLFFSMLLSRLEEEMPDEPAKTKFKSFYFGTERHQVIGSCGHISDSSGEFLNLSLTVKGKADLIASLDEYVEGEQMEDSNKFRCSECESEQRKDTLVDACRRTRLDTIPSNLVVGLKRFEYITGRAEKINDRLDFPPILDMAKYTVQFAADQSQQPPQDLFELVGVVVHQGSLNFGHYWTYTKDHTTYGQPEGKWWRIEDSKAAQVTMQDAVEAGRGSTSNRTRLFERSDNAYVLFYRRLGGRTELNGYATSVPDDNASTTAAIDQDNKQARETANFFDGACLEYIDALMLKSGSSCSCTECGYDYEKAALSMGLQYLLRVWTHHEKDEGVARIANSIVIMVERNRKLATDALLMIFGDEKALDRFLSAPQAVGRQTMINMVVKIMEKAAIADPVFYGIAVQEKTDREGPDESTLLCNIARAVLNKFDEIVALRYPVTTYFAFLMRFAMLGSVEGRMLARSTVLENCLTLLYVPYTDEAKQRFNELAQHLQSSDTATFHWAAVVDLINFILTSVTEYHPGLLRGQESFHGQGIHEAPARIFTNQEEKKMIEDTYWSAHRGRMLSLPYVAMHLCPIWRSTTALNWPPARLLATLTSSQFDVDYAKKALASITYQITKASNESEYERGILVAEHVCCYAEVPFPSRLHLFKTILERTPYEKGMLPRAISWLERVARNLVGSAELTASVHEFAMWMLFSDKVSARAKMAAFLTRLVGLDSKELPVNSLAASLRKPEVLLEILEGMVSVIRDNIDERASAAEYVKFSTRAFIVITEFLVYQNQEVMTLVVQGDATGVQNYLYSLRISQAHREKYYQIVTRLGAFYEEIQRFKQAAHRHGWLGTSSKKRDSEELDDDEVAGSIRRGSRRIRLTIPDTDDDELSEPESTTVELESEQEIEVDVNEQSAAWDDDQWVDDGSDTEEVVEIDND